MEAWREDQVSALLSAESEIDLFNRAAQIANEMGFEYCAYRIRMAVPISRPVVATFNNYSRAWRDCDEARGDLELNADIRHALKSALPIVWSNDAPDGAPEFLELCGEADGLGLRYGWSQTTRDAWGCVGLLTLSRSGGKLTEAELCAKAAHMAWLTQLTHAGMSRLLRPKLAPETLVSMTAREREVLLWTAEGKTAYEISQILTVSERTVNFHINNVVSKLGASNKTQAAVKATALGMLF